MKVCVVELWSRENVEEDGRIREMLGRERKERKVVRELDDLGGLVVVLKREVEMGVGEKVYLSGSEWIEVEGVEYGVESGEYRVYGMVRGGE
jgi:hypothetical protein